MIDKVVFLFSPGPFGGAERVILTGANLLPNCEIWIIQELRNKEPSVDFIQRCESSNITTRLFTCKSRFDLRTLIKLRKEVKFSSIRLIHSHGLKANFYNAFLPTIRVATQHGKTSLSLKVKLFELMEHIALKRMHGVICVSQKMFSELNYSNKILIENFLSFIIKKKVYSTLTPIQLVSIGRLSPEKGIADIIDLIGSNSSLTLTIVGSGIEEESLKYKSRHYKNIYFEGFKKEVGAYFQHSDALIMPSHREGLPMVLIEACGAGLPVLTSNVGGMPALVKENGYLFEAKDTESIKKAISNFVQNREMINKGAQKLSNKIQTQYSKENWKENTLKFYQSLL